jgi:ABC-type phosphate/phosphonate transport system ATPase subunit
MAIEPHDIDTVIGEKKRSGRDIARAIAHSRELYAIVEKAVQSADELPPGVCGPSFPQQVRVAIARNLLNEE